MHRTEAQKRAKRERKAECQWFYLCDRGAVTTVKHPVLGDVPCCQRCADFARA